MCADGPGPGPARRARKPRLALNFYIASSCAPAVSRCIPPYLPYPPISPSHIWTRPGIYNKKYTSSSLRQRAPRVRAAAHSAAQPQPDTDTDTQLTLSPDTQPDTQLTSSYKRDHKIRRCIRPVCSPHAAPALRSTSAQDETTTHAPHLTSGHRPDARPIAVAALLTTCGGGSGQRAQRALTLSSSSVIAP